MIRLIPQALRDMFDRKSPGAAARNSHFALEEQLTHLSRNLAAVSSHTVRAQLLAVASRVMTAQAAGYPTAWGPDWLDDDEMDMAESSRWSALLLALLAEVEAAIAQGVPRVHAVNRLEHAAGPVLDRIVAAGRMDEYLRDELSAAVCPVVGAQAAETVAALPLGPVA